MNRAIRALTLSGATADATGTAIDNSSGRGAHVVINISAISGTTPTATFTITGLDDDPQTTTPNTWTILASSALNATGTTVLRVYPALTASANVVANDILPRWFRVDFTIGGTNTPTVSATVQVLLHD